MTDITLGHYYPTDSFVHKLDPRTKLICIALLMTGLLFTFNILVLAAYFFICIFLIKAARLPFPLVLNNLKPFIWLFGITMIVHLFFTQGEHYYQLPIVPLKLSIDGLKLGLVYSFRLGLLIIIAAIMTLATSPIELTDALERLLDPLNKIKVPVHEIVMMLTLSLRFIPTLLEEAERLKNAQLSRGATFDGSLIHRVKSIVPLILPMFVSAFRRADDLAMAMDARCYVGGEGRTSFKKLAYSLRDFVSITLTIFVVIATIWISRL